MRSNRKVHYMIHDSLVKEILRIMHDDVSDEVQSQVFTVRGSWWWLDKVLVQAQLERPL